jgi:hypothetical protein
VLGNEITEARTFVQLGHQNQGTVGGDSRSLEIDLEGAVEGELEWLICFYPLDVDLQRVFVALKSARIKASEAIKKLSVTTENGNSG